MTIEATRGEAQGEAGSAGVPRLKAKTTAVNRAAPAAPNCVRKGRVIENPGRVGNGWGTAIPSP